MSNFKSQRRLSESSSSTRPLDSPCFSKEVTVPMNAAKIIIGKGGNTIQRFQHSPGISSVRYSSGKVHISGHSEEAVQRVVSSIELLLAGYAADKAYFNPDFYALCFCKSLENSLRPVTKVCFEKVPRKLSNRLFEVEDVHRHGMDPYFFFKLGEWKSEGERYTDSPHNLPGKFLKKTYTSITDTLVFSHWDLSAYKSELAMCLEHLLAQQREPMRAIKLIVRFGKVLFYGGNCSQLLNGGFMSLQCLQELCRRRCLNQQFSTACTERAVKQTLENLEYVKVPSGKKVSVHVVDFEADSKRNVSIRCDGDQYGALFQHTEVARIADARDYFQVLGVDALETIPEAGLKKAYRRCTIGIHPDVIGRMASEAAIGIVKEAYECLLDPAKRHQYLTNNVNRPSDGKPLCPSLSEICRADEKVDVTRVRNQPKRHAFVTLLREGLSTSDIRLGISSHVEEADTSPELGKWIENAWKNRTPDQLLVFEPTDRFKVLTVRYKQTETYMTEAWKFRISRVCGKDGKSNARWEYALSSRWFKQKQKSGNGMAEGEIGSIMDNICGLVGEAAKLGMGMTAK